MEIRRARTVTCDRASPCSSWLTRRAMPRGGSPPLSLTAQGRSSKWFPFTEHLVGGGDKELDVGVSYWLVEPDRGSAIGGGIVTSQRGGAARPVQKSSSRAPGPFRDVGLPTSHGPRSNEEMVVRLPGRQPPPNVATSVQPLANGRTDS